jgi:hypothetical protein
LFLAAFPFLPSIATTNLEPLLATLAEKVIAPAEGKVKALQERRRMIEAELTICAAKLLTQLPTQSLAHMLISPMPLAVPKNRPSTHWTPGESIQRRSMTVIAAPTKSI